MSYYSRLWQAWRNTPHTIPFGTGYNLYRAYIAFHDYYKIIFLSTIAVDHCTGSWFKGALRGHWTLCAVGLCALLLCACPCARINYVTLLFHSSIIDISSILINDSFDTISRRFKCNRTCFVAYRARKIFISLFLFLSFFFENGDFTGGKSGKHLAERTGRFYTRSGRAGGCEILPRFIFDSTICSFRVQPRNELHHERCLFIRFITVPVSTFVP